MNKYAVVFADMERKINEGLYRPGQKLPSVRSAAKHYSCSVSTIIRSYAELEKRHAIYSISQSGYYVVENSVDPLSGKGDGSIDFSSVLPDLELFPYVDFQHCLNKAIDTYRHQLFTYGDAMGLDKLRRTLASHLANDQIFVDAERVAVTSGAQQALEKLAKMPFPNGNTHILVEQPSYDLYLRYLESEGIPVSGIARTSSGIDLRELEDKFRTGDVKFFYTMSRYHNPLGTSYNAETRKEIARLAVKYNVYVVEDDYMADLGEERSFDPIYSYNGSTHVIYVKSFSKIIFPGLRLGVAVLPESLLETFHAYKAYADTSLLSQAALEVYINNGMYERHKRKISAKYTERMHVLHAAAERYNEAGLIDISKGSSGMYTQFKLPQTVNMEQLMKRLAARNVKAVPGKGFYLANYLNREKFLRISISKVQPDAIEEGVKAIVEEVKRVSWA